MDVFTDNDWELILSLRSLDFFQNAHLVDAIMSIDGIAVWSSSFTVESTAVRSFNNDLVEHLADPTI